MANNRLLILFKTNTHLGGIKDNKGEIHKTAKKYCHEYKDVVSYFVIADENIESDDDIFVTGDEIYVNMKENNWESLLIKVIKAINHFRDGGYSHVLVSNITTFVNIPLMFQECDDKFNCKAYINPIKYFKDVVYPFPSGACYMLNYDLARQICDFFINNKYILDNNTFSDEFISNYPTTDDIFLGYYLHINNLAVTALPRLHIWKLIGECKNVYTHYRIYFEDRSEEYKMHQILYRDIYSIPESKQTVTYELRERIHKITLTDGVEHETVDTYDCVKGLWIAKVSLTYDSTKLITNSNHFIDNFIRTNDFGQEDGNYTPKRKPHYIYSRIINNYYKVARTDLIPIVVLDRCVFLHNSFSSGNAGHDLCCMLNILQKYLNDDSIKFVLFNEIDTNNLNIVKLLVDDSRLIRIDANKIYNFKKQIFNTEIGVHNFTHYISLINVIKQGLISKAETEFDTYKLASLKAKKVIIIKNTTNEFVVRSEDSVDATIMFDYLKDQDWYICNPERCDFLEFVYVLLNADIIVTGERGISCSNQMFYNLDSTIIGFIAGQHKDFIIDDNKIRYDGMCNSIYHSKITKRIVSPLSINDIHLDQIKKVFEALT